MVSGKVPDPYKEEDYTELAGGDVGQQWLSKMKAQQSLLGNLQASAEALAGKGAARKDAFGRQADDYRARQAQSAYTGRRMGAEAMLSELSGKGRAADATWFAQMADIDAQALDDDSVAAMAKAKVDEQKIAMGTESEKTLETLASLQPMVEGWKESYDSFWGADEDGFFEAGSRFARANLPPHMRAQFMEMYIMPSYRDWGGSSSNPFSKGTPSSGGGAVASQGSQNQNIAIDAPPAQGDY